MGKSKIQTLILVLVSLSLIGGGLFFLTGSDDDTVTIQGIVTVEEENCQPVKRLVAGRVVVDEGATICDAGSFIVVDETRIQTATGLVAGGSYNKHPSDLEPGDRVFVTMTRETNDLSCDSCVIEYENPFDN